MKIVFSLGAMPLLILALAASSFGQAGFFAVVTGTVTDSSSAVIPGVTIKATATETGVVSTTISNESGSYNFANLLPGKYTLTASLPGFQTKNITGLELSQNTSYRYNFQMTVATVNTQVEVSVSGDTILATSGASVGQVLSQQKVQDLPIVGNNVLDLITVMAGVENIVPTNPPSAANAFGRESTTFAGVSAQNIAIVRDGIQVQDNRYPNGIYSATTINPDLVGEIRLILAPVDAEMGRGNGAIQYSTRSGTNKYSGSAVWSFRNTALDPNTWTNKRTLGGAVQPDWSNVHQGTVSFGGPIVRNKTFFFALYDFNMVNQRVSNNMTVLTPCARLGIFRYFKGWNNGNVFTNVVTTGANPTRSSVDVNGNPVAPTTLPNGSTTNPDNTPYDPSLQAFSVFGPLQSQPTAADCSNAPINAATLVPNGVSLSANPGQPSGGWDQYRRQMDTTGYIARMLSFFPEPNNYEVGDGLNTAGFRLLRHFTGLDNLFGSGEATGRRKQINVKIDQNFASAHKANVNVTYERVDSDDVLAIFPGSFSNKNFRRPIVISSGLTSTLSSSLLNEARFGMRRQGTNVIAPWDRPEYQDAINQYFPPMDDGFRVVPQISALNLCYPHSGVRPGVSGPANCGANGAVTATSIDKTPTYTYADTLSWTHGAHAFKFGGEFRDASSEAKTSTATFFSNFAVATLAIGGSVPGTTTQGQTSATDIQGTSTTPNPAMLGLLATNGTNARALSNYLAGSLSNITNLYFTTDPNDLSQWSDYRDKQFLTTKLVQREFSAFLKDDYKITKNLTLNLGLRWDYYGVPYVASGLTVRAVGGGDAVFGISGRDFTGWMRPGERAPVTSVEFVGPHSPNPDRTVYPNDYNNFGPAIGFAWNVPWFGEGKTTVRGGYQVTYQGGGRFNTLQGPLASPPGSTLEASPNFQNTYVDLTSIPTVLPITPLILPMQPIPTTARSQNFTTFDSHYVNPYVQNLTLSVTRSVNKNLTFDLRYVGTLSRKQYTTLNINTPNFLYNGLVDEFNAARTSTEVPGGLLDQMLSGINLCTAGCTANQPYGAIGSTVGGVYQSAGYQMRSNPTFQNALANAYYGTAPAFNTPLASVLNTLNYTTTGSNASLPAIQPGTLGNAMRLNGFPDNFVATNPQFGNMNLLTNGGSSNYHSLQFQATLRPTQGFSAQATYTWSKNLGLGAIANPVDRSADYTNINNNPGHTLRTNGTIELPMGPNKLLFGNTSGALARALERWQLGLIFNLNSGYPVSITAQSMLYGNGVPDIVYPVDFNQLKGTRWGVRNGSFLEGRYFDQGNVFVKDDDPVCATVAANIRSLCSLDALYMAVPAGTAGATDKLFNDGVTRPAVVVLQHPAPGKKGNLGNNTVIGPGTFRFDANLGKTFQISEGKSLQVRFDAQNVLNHPQPSSGNSVIPALSITGTDAFGRFDQKLSTSRRLFQGQVRLSF